jgi:3-hydroxybutyryl-CoA dehydratase
MSDLGYPRRVLNEFSIGQIRESLFSISPDEFSNFIQASGDRHPLHTNQDFAKQRGYPDVLLHGMCIAARCSNFITYEFVGSHGLLVSMTADFRRPAFVCDPFLWRAEVISIELQAQTAAVKWQVLTESGVLIQRGTACAWISEE